MPVGRPRYETAENIADQERIIRPYCNMFDYTSHRTPDLARADYELFKDEELVAYAEVKRRFINFFKFDTIMLSQCKVEALLNRDVPALFIVGFDDALGWVRLTPDHLKTARFGGRTVQTRDAWDKEDVCHIPTSDFTVALKGPEGTHIRPSVTQWHDDELQPID